MTERRGNRITDVLSCYDGLARCMIDSAYIGKGPATAPRTLSGMKGVKFTRLLGGSCYKTINEVCDAPRSAIPQGQQRDRRAPHRQVCKKKVKLRLLEGSTGRSADCPTQALSSTR